MGRRCEPLLIDCERDRSCERCSSGCCGRLRSLDAERPHGMEPIQLDTGPRLVQGQLTGENALGLGHDSKRLTQRTQRDRPQ